MQERKAMKVASGNIRDPESGFTLTEMMVSSLLFLVGLVAVAQLVPAAITLNLRNRNDSSALTYAQRELVHMLDQPLSSSTYTTADGTPCPGSPCQLGDPNLPNTVVGSPVVTFNGMPVIDYGPAATPGYNFILSDPNDPTGTSYDIRWAVITVSQGAGVLSKRFIVGAWRRGGNSFATPVTIDAWVQK